MLHVQNRLTTREDGRLAELRIFDRFQRFNALMDEPSTGHPWSQGLATICQRIYMEAHEIYETLFSALPCGDDDTHCPFAHSPQVTP